MGDRTALMYDGLLVGDTSFLLNGRILKGGLQ